MNYEIGGTYTISVYGTIEANSEAEAIQLYKQKVEKAVGGDCVELDWIEELSCEAKPLPDYKKIFNDTMHKSGSGTPYETIKKPQVIFEGAICNNGNNVTVVSTKMKIGEMTYMLLIGEKAYFPCEQETNALFTYKNASYAPTTSDFLFSTFWFDENNSVFVIGPDGDMIELVRISNEGQWFPTVLYHRLLKLQNLTLCKHLRLVCSKSNELLVRDAYTEGQDEVLYHATYYSHQDETPNKLYKEERIY